MAFPIASYSFDESSGDILDRSGNGRDWSLNNNLGRTVSGHSNFGITKVTGGTNVAIVAEPSFIDAEASWTMMFWRQFPGNAPWWMRFFNELEDSGHGILDVGSGLMVRIRESGGTSRQSTPVTTPTDGLWHHYAATYDGANGRLYIDGVLVGTTPPAVSPVAADRIDGFEYSELAAIDDDLRFFDVALEQEEIEHYMNTPVVDDTAVGEAIFIYNGTSWVGTVKNIWNGSTWLEVT